mgnify:CR=1 FL=1
MYDVDGNGYIDLSEMTKIVKSIYNMMGPNHVAMDQFESPEARAKGIFARMDVNSDGKVILKAWYFIVTFITSGQDGPRHIPWLAYLPLRG